MRDSIPRFAKLRVENPSGDAEHDDKVEFLWSCAQLFDPSDNATIKRMLQESFANDSKSMSTARLEILAKYMPETPDLGKAILEAGNLRNSQVSRLSQMVGPRFDQAVKEFSDNLRSKFETLKESSENEQMKQLRYHFDRLEALGSHAAAGHPLLKELQRWALDENNHVIASMSSRCIRNTGGDMPYVEEQLAEALKRSDELESKLAPLEAKVIAKKASLATIEQHKEVLHQFSTAKYRAKYLTELRDGK